jgi:hypothetical protein
MIDGMSEDMTWPLYSDTWVEDSFPIPEGMKEKKMSEAMDYYYITTPDMRLGILVASEHEQNVVSGSQCYKIVWLTDRIHLSLGGEFFPNETKLRSYCEENNYLLYECESREQLLRILSEKVVEFEAVLEEKWRRRDL